MKKLAVMGAVLGLLAPCAWSLDTHQADSLVNQWLSLEHQTNRLESDWRAQKPLLEQRIELLTAQRAQLRKVLSDSQSSSNEAETKRAELLEKQTIMESEQSGLEATISRLGSQLASIAQQLPPPLQRSWQNEAQALTENATSSVKLQVMLAQLTQLMEFDQRVTVNEAQIKDHQGSDVLVNQLYLGAGVAWFANADGSISGIGLSEPDGWTWSSDEHVNGDIVTKAINMFNQQQEARLITLPIRLIGQAP